MTDKENPPLDQLADDEDELGWDREKHGRMRDYATPDDTIQTKPYGEEGDDGVPAWNS